MGFEFYKDWMEFFFLLLIVLGIIVALSAPSAVISYIIIFLCGMIAGRLLYNRHRYTQFPYVIIVTGFIIGYMIGVYYGSRVIVVVLFVLGSILSYKLYDKKIIKDVKY